MNINLLNDINNYKKYKEERLLKRIRKLPFELINIIKNFLPIHTIKLLRKIKKHEIPEEYILLQKLRDYYYDKYLYYGSFKDLHEINIMQYKNYIELNKKKYMSSYKACSVTFFMYGLYFHKKIDEYTDLCLESTIYKNSYLYMFFSANSDIRKYNIIISNEH